MLRQLATLKLYICILYTIIITLLPSLFFFIITLYLHLAVQGETTPPEME